MLHICVHRYEACSMCHIMGEYKVIAFVHLILIPLPASPHLGTVFRCSFVCHRPSKISLLFAWAVLQQK